MQAHVCTCTHEEFTYMYMYGIMYTYMYMYKYMYMYMYMYRYSTYSCLTLPIFDAAHSPGIAFSSLRDIHMHTDHVHVRKYVHVGIFTPCSCMYMYTNMHNVHACTTHMVLPYRLALSISSHTPSQP